MSDQFEGYNVELASLMDAVRDFITTRIAHLEGVISPQHQFLVIIMDRDRVEICADLSDHHAMVNSMANIVADWVEEGLLEDEDPLFTATFDPQKVRPS